VGAREEVGELFPNSVNDIIIVPMTLQGVPNQGKHRSFESTLSLFSSERLCVKWRGYVVD
jgi:hypothetical protein